MAQPDNNDTAFFHAINNAEKVAVRQSPKHRIITCGVCGNTTNARVVCEYRRSKDRAVIAWCLCTCEKAEPSVIVERSGQPIQQFPNACPYQEGVNWPPELSRLYGEASMAYAAGAFTAVSMVCRKLLMACACHENAEDGKNFAHYVSYITDQVLTFPRAKAAIDAIREIGNEANHHVQFVTPDDAKRSMEIVTYMLNAIYSLPTA